MVSRYRMRSVVKWARSARFVMRAVSFGTIATALFSLGQSLYTYFRYRYHTLDPSWRWAVTVLFLASFAMCSASYIFVVKTRPGFPPDFFDVEQYIARGFNIKYCHYCQRYKPPRTHHDKVTGRCVLRMDHFCIWSGGTIGYFNEKYFVLFLFYSVIFILTNLAIYAEPMLYLMGIVHLPEGTYSGDQLNNFMYISSIGVALLLGSFGFLLWNMYLVFTNQTSVEVGINKYRSIRAKKLGVPYKNIYDLGRENNFRQFFDLGPNDSLWKALVSFGKRKGDGIKFQTIDFADEIDLRLLDEQLESSSGSSSRSDYFHLD